MVIIQPICWAKDPLNSAQHLKLLKGMNVNSVKRVFNSVRSIINLNIREYGSDDTNAFSGI